MENGDRLIKLAHNVSIGAILLIVLFGVHDYLVMREETMRQGFERLTAFCFRGTGRADEGY